MAIPFNPHRHPGGGEIYLKDSFCFLIGLSTARAPPHRTQDSNVSFTSTTRKITGLARQTPCLLDICISIHYGDSELARLATTTRIVDLDASTQYEYAMHGEPALDTDRYRTIVP